MKRDPKGRLELTWMGKDSALIPVETGKYDYMWVDPTDPRAVEVKTLDLVNRVGSTTKSGLAANNLLIIGESGDALRSLVKIPEYAEKYVGQVRLVYIDPPFNTGQTFTNYADQMEHSIWLTMMRDRLRSIKPLLAPDASIWVHLDDAEVHRMRVLLDEELGADRFLGTVVWQKADGPRNDLPNFSPDHDYILVYSASPATHLRRSARSDSLNSIYRASDGDDTPWYDDNPTAPSAERNQGWVYAIQNPLTGEWMYPANGRCWGAKQETVFEALSEYAKYDLVDLDDAPRRALICDVPEDEVRQGVKGMRLAVPLEESRLSVEARRQAGPLPTFIIRNGGTIGRKRYQPDTGSNVRTLWFNEDVGHNRQAKAEIKALFPGKNPFSTPKPEALLQRVLQAATDPGDLVLDCFAGSGTTAAVAHKMGRRWVTIELQERTVSEFTLPRLAKVVEGSDLGGISIREERLAAAALPDGVSPEAAHQFTRALRQFSEGQELDLNVVALAITLIRALQRSDNPPLSDEQGKTVLKLLREVAKSREEDCTMDVMPQVNRLIKGNAKTRIERTTLWSGGGGFDVVRLGPSMYEVDDEDGEVYLSPAAVNGTWSKAVAAQLGFTLTPDHAVFCGVRGRQRLLVVDGVADEQVVPTAVEHLADKERVVIVAKSVLPGAADLLAKLSPGSRIKKAPTDIFPKGTVK